LRVVSVAGELDSLTAPTLSDLLHEQLRTKPTHLVIDLAAVTFMGSAALAILLQCSAQLPPGSTLHLSGTVRRAVHRPLMVTGLLPRVQHLPHPCGRAGAHRLGPWHCRHRADRGSVMVAVRMSQVAAVLADLVYPAAKWQVLAEADHYGGNIDVRSLLWALPAGSYESLETIRAALLGPPNPPSESP
jgi:anti-sigma B factor antagonist